MTVFPALTALLKFLIAVTVEEIALAAFHVANAAPTPTTYGNIVLVVSSIFGNLLIIQSKPFSTFGKYFSASGSSSSDFAFLPSFSKRLPKSSYLMSAIFSSVFAVLSASPSVFVSALTASAPRSSHIVPKSATPAASCATLSSIEKRASKTSFVASFAESPPSANLAKSSSAVCPPLLALSCSERIVSSFEDNSALFFSSSSVHFAILSSIFIF